MLLQLSDKELGPALDGMLVDLPKSVSHKATDLNFGEQLQTLSLELLRAILSYNQNYVNLHEAYNMGPHLMNELAGYVRLRRDPRKYLGWCLRHGFVHRFGYLRAF